MEGIAFLALWVALWIGVSYFLSRINKSRIISIGGGFIASLFLLAIVSTIIEKREASSNLQIAQDAGFTTYEKYSKARSLGFGTKAEFEEHQAQQLQLEEERKKKQRERRIAEKKEEERLCKKDIQCWGDKKNIAAAFACDGEVEKLAKYDFEWTDGFFEPKFSHFRWRNKDRLIITYIGDKIKFQNAFGAWQRHTYECDYDTERDLALKVSARPGRIK